jgi:hypothetical protein
MFERVIRKEIDGGVGCGEFSVNANFDRSKPHKVEVYMFELKLIRAVPH